MRELLLRLKKVFSLNPEREMHSSELLHSLLSMAQTIPFNLGMEETLSFLLNEFQKNFPVSCGIVMLDEDSRFRIKSHRGFSADFVEMIQEKGTEFLNLAYSKQKEMVLSRSQISKIPELEQIASKEKWEHLTIAPLTIQFQALGLFVASSQDRDSFTDTNLKRMAPFLQVLSVGIRNCQLSEKMERFSRRLEAEVTATTEELTKTNQRLIHRVWELKALYDVTTLIAVSPSVEKLCAAVIPKLKEIFEFEFAAIFLKRFGKGSFVELSAQFPSFDLPLKQQELLRIQISKVHEMLLPVLETVNTGKMKFYSGPPVSLRECFSIQEISGELEKIRIHSYVALPLSTSHGLLGTLLLVNPTKNQLAHEGDTSSLKSTESSFQNFPYSEEALRTLTLIASQLGTAIENLELEQENRRRLEDLSTLHEISEIVYAKPIFEFNLGKICELILDSLSCDSCAFYFLDSLSGDLVLRNSAVSSASSEALTERVSLNEESHFLVRIFRSGKSQILSLEQETQPQPTSVLLVPLKAEQAVLGVLELRKKEKSFFTPHHLRLAELIAARLAALEQSARLYEKILLANKELERLNRVKTEFVSMVSHELRTPLTAIKGFVDVVMSEEAGALNEQQKRFLKIAHNSIDRLAFLISDLLDISRIESGQIKMEMSETSMEKILQEATETYRKTIEGKGISFHVETDKKLPRILADASRLKQVIDNLLSNAMKFTPAGGTVRIYAEDMGDFVLVSVTDTGIGIKKEEQEKIFEKFFQADSSLTRQVGGTGLGLAISKAIIEMHGGRIWVESEIGKGSTFRFLLPRLRKGHFVKYENGSGTESSPSSSSAEIVSLKARAKKAK